MPRFLPLLCSLSSLMEAFGSSIRHLRLNLQRICGLPKSLNFLKAALALASQRIHKISSFGLNWHGRGIFRRDMEPATRPGACRALTLPALKGTTDASYFTVERFHSCSLG